VVFGGSDRAVVCVLGKGVRAATERADDESGRTTASVHVMAEPVTAGTLREEGTAYKRFDGSCVNAEEGRGVALHEFEAGAVGVMEGEDNAGGILAGGKVGWVSKPTRRKEYFTAITNSIVGELVLEILGRGNRAIWFTVDRDTADNDMSKAGDQDAASAGAKGGAEGRVENRDFLWGGGALECEDKVLSEGVGRGPMTGKKLERGADGVKAVSYIAHEFVGRHGVEKGGLRGGVVKDDGIVGATKRLREGSRLAAAKGHGVGRGGGSNGLNTRRGRGGVGSRGGFRFWLVAAPGNSGKGHRGGGGAKFREGGVRLGIEGGNGRVRDKAD